MKGEQHMNNVSLIGRLTRDPEIRYTQNQMAVARFTLAVDRMYKKEGEQSADFINCIAFEKRAELIERYCRQGMKIGIAGRIQTGSYTNREGKKVYTTDIIVNEIEFCEKKEGIQPKEEPEEETDDFVEIPEGIQEELPFNTAH